MRKLMMAALLALPMFGATAMAQDTVKIAYIDPLSVWLEDQHPMGVAVPALAKEG